MGVLSVSADGGLIGTGIVWTTRPSDCPAGDHSDMDHRPCNAEFKIVPGVLKAFDANNLAELWSSSSPPDSLGMLGKFNPSSRTGECMSARSAATVRAPTANADSWSCTGVRPGT